MFRLPRHQARLGGTVSMALLAAATLTGTAQAAFEPVGPSLSAAVADADAAVPTFAYQPRAGSIAVRNGALSRTFDVPAECRPAAIDRAAIALSCQTATSNRLAVLDTDSGAIRDVPDASGFTGAPVALGTTWMLVSGSRTVDAVGHIDSAFYAIRLADGAIRSLRSDRPSRRQFVDLDRAGLSRNLCGPVTRQRYVGADARLALTTVSGSWVLQNTADRWLAGRCGKPRLRAIDGQAPVLSRGRLIYERRGVAFVEQVVDDKVVRRRLRLPTGDSHSVTASAGRIVASTSPTTKDRAVQIALQRP